jgi:putative sigma-54 modulation protein
MRVEVRVKSVEATRQMREQVEMRARLALGRHADRVERVQILLEDVNGPRGGSNDKRCRVRWVGPGLGSRVIEASSGELGAAVADALERASRLTRRLLDRLRAEPLRATRPWLPTS